MIRAVPVLLLLTAPALGQQPDPAKLLPWVQSQREANANAVAQCSAIATELQAKVADLEKQLAETKAKLPEAPN